MMKYLCSKIIVSALLVTALAGCRQIPAYFSSDKTLAKAGGRELQMHDVEGVVPQGVSGKDSVDFMTVYIDRWVRQQLKLRQAELLFSDSADDIDKMVEEYRQALLIRKLDQYYVDRGIDTLFTDDQIAAYYNDHKADFRLDRTVVKGCIVSFDDRSRQSRQLRKLMEVTSAAQQKNFRDICEKNGFKMVDFGGEWVDFSEFLSNLPTVRTQNYDPLLTKSGVQEMHDRLLHYYFRIDAVRNAGDAAPLSQVRNMIRRVLFNQRQSEIIHKYEDELYAKAREKGDIKIFAKDTTDVKDTVKVQRQ